MVFNRRFAITSTVVPLPCGQCIGCRLEKSRQWAVRLMHERQMHDVAYFITFTYSPDNLPADNSLNKRDMQLFLKRFREKFGRFRYFYCGEYGEVNGRPHYHAIIFGAVIPDLRHYKDAKDGSPLFTSDKLDNLWRLGLCVVGDVTFDSAAYVARYSVKKITGARADEHYIYVDDDGLIHSILPEFADMSRRPGIGMPWLHKFGKATFDSDTVVMNGKAMKPPRYYDDWFSTLDADRLERLKLKRRKRAERKLKAASRFEPDPRSRGLSRNLVSMFVAHERLKRRDL